MRVLTMESAGGSLTLDEVSGIRAGLKIRGTGLPPVQTQWFEGAGDGASFRGGRSLPRILDMPLKVYGADRQEVLERLSRVGRILVLDNAPVRLTAALDGEEWYADFVRTGGGDWTWGEDTDGKTWVKTVVTMQAGDPYWTAVDSESRRIITGGLGIPLLGPGQSLVQLLLSSTAASGVVTFSNSGDVEAWPIWEVEAPFTGFTLARGSRSLTWTGTKGSGFIRLDTRQGTVVDETGANRYSGLSTAPKFWTIPQGESEGSLVIAGATSATKASVEWFPRKALIF